MKITAIKTYPVNIPLKQPFRIALGESTEYEGLIVIIETDEGLSGVGEASPSPRITGDTMGGVLSAVERFTPLLMGKNPLFIGERMNAINSSLLYNSSAKCAVDIALHDIAGKSAGMPLKTLLGGCKEAIETDITIGLKSIEDTLKEARDIVREGFNIIKVKIGEDPEIDIEKIRDLREEIGKDIVLRVDANQGYTVKQAIEVARRLERYEVELIEQPVPFWDIEGMKIVKNSVEIPVMADESVHSTQDAVRLIRERACDYINIKLMKTGGIREAVKIAGIAEGAGMKCMIGCMGETKVAITAAAHFALGVNSVEFADLDSHLTLKKEIAEGGLNIKNGMVTVPETGGIGISLKN
ncbi:dipeptide epimerase [candidate division WOR-3 bacterium]|nr:dipeptide epimerase [candidate division WOR-3 bacterium]